MNKWKAVAVLESCVLLGGCVWLYHGKIEEQKRKQEEQELYKPYDFDDTSSEEVRITMSNYKYMAKFKRFDAAKKIQFDAPVDVGMEWICPARDVIKILKKCPADLDTINLCCCEISDDVLRLLFQKFTKLKHLELCCSILEQIPDEITNLKELETLRIEFSVPLKEIPASVFKLPKLKKLIIRDTYALPKTSELPKELEIEKFGGSADTPVLIYTAKQLEFVVPH